ncbi:MAG: helix-turn-helix domain-containing protein [Oscillospiraceae bacterium]
MSYLESLYAQDVPHRAIAVYRYLKDRANKDGTCYPSIGTIAKDLNLSRRTVQRAIADLEQTGHLQKEQRWRENGGKSSLLFTVK